jgi:enoyl-CoA hydratase/carnithine racemase
VLAHPPLNLIATQFSDCLREAVHQASDSDSERCWWRAEGPLQRRGDVLDFIDKDFNAWRTFISEMHHSYRAIEALQIPTIAAVRGAAYGGAFELALACRSHRRGRKLHLPLHRGFRRLGPGRRRRATPGGACGRAMAARYAMLSEPMSGTTAGQLGVAAFVVPETDVEGTATMLAGKLSAGPTRSYGAIRALLRPGPGAVSPEQIRSSSTSRWPARDGRRPPRAHGQGGGHEARRGAGAVVFAGR